jgi:hypothetical protein
MAAVILVWIGDPVSWVYGEIIQLTIYGGVGVAVGGSGVGVAAGGGGGPGVFVGGTGASVGASGITVSVGTSGVGVSVGGTGVSVAVAVGKDVGVQSGVKVNVGRGVFVGCIVGVGALTNSVPTEHPNVSNMAAITSTATSMSLLSIIGFHFKRNQMKSQRHALGSVL